MASNSVVAKNRFHRGVTAEFRKIMRRVGVSLDEEQAQFILGGVMPFAGQPSEFMDEARDHVIANRHQLMRDWEAANPKRNPYPPSFPDRVLSLVRKALEEFNTEDGVPLPYVLRIEAIASAETRSDPFSPPDDAPVQ